MPVHMQSAPYNLCTTMSHVRQPRGTRPRAISRRVVRECAREQDPFVAWSMGDATRAHGSDASQCGDAVFPPTHRLTEDRLDPCRVHTTGGGCASRSKMNRSATATSDVHSDFDSYRGDVSGVIGLLERTRVPSKSLGLLCESFVRLYMNV